MLVADTSHLPVMLEEVVGALAIRAGGCYVDCTFGRGGHARAVLARLGEQGRLLAIDRDPLAASAAQAMGDPRMTVRHGSFDRLEEFTGALGWSGHVDGVLFDLGVSSPQLDDPERGFSFQREGPLDMRMDTTSGISAAEWLAHVNERDLSDCLHRYGEERHARRIARAILAARAEKSLLNTRALAEVVAQAHPAWPRGQHPATRTFQAIRIFVNDELGQLKRGLTQALRVLAIGGRLLVVSFHSLEDRIVKQFMRHEAARDEQGVLPVERPAARLRIPGRAIRPRAAEVSRNPRARSAVLRVAQKIA